MCYILLQLLSTQNNRAVKKGAIWGKKFQHQKCWPRNDCDDVSANKF